MTTAKRWAISATLSTARGLSFQKDGQSLDPMTDSGSGLSPMQYLLLSAAGCMALSLRAAALDAGKPLQSIRVTAAGTKPGASPSRLSHVELQVVLVPVLTPEEADALIAAAQQLCTVTNTIRDSAQFSVHIGPSAVAQAARTHPAPLTGDSA